ncbi:caspase domain-containing protein [Flagelloscypha sp. PMI_526]|nr:caspase domain-containing protein [Flagelloscypha sp. PMI_526]
MGSDDEYDEQVEEVEEEEVEEEPAASDEEHEEDTTLTRPPDEALDYDVVYEDEEGNTHSPQYRYSQCTGKKKALFVGINYFNSSSELRGCINDVQNISAFLVEHHGFEWGENIRLLTDDQNDPDLRPTAKNIMEGMMWLVEDAEPDDSLWFSYSGHGMPVRDEDGDEDDGQDECICPCDMDETGVYITDDVMHHLLVKTLPEGCRLTVLMDFSTFLSSILLMAPASNPDLAAEGQAGLFIERHDRDAAIESAREVIEQVLNKEKPDIPTYTKTSVADVIAFSGCLDNQTSADAQEAGKATGAVSWAFKTALTTLPEQTWGALLQNLHTLLEDKYTQKPMLTTSHPLDTKYVFYV